MKDVGMETACNLHNEMAQMNTEHGEGSISKKEIVEWTAIITHVLKGRGIQKKNPCIFLFVSRLSVNYKDTLKIAFIFCRFHIEYVWKKGSILSICIKKNILCIQRITFKEKHGELHKNMRIQLVKKENHFTVIN